MMNLAISATYSTIKVSEEASKLDVKAEVLHGLSIGAAHGVPMVATVLAAKLFLSSQGFDIMSTSLLSACAMQFLAPAATLAMLKSRLHKNTNTMLWTGLVLAGISNGVIVSYLMH